MRMAPFNVFKNGWRKAFYWFHCHQKLSVARGKADDDRGDLR